MTLFVCASTAATSEARKFSPSPMPTMSGTFMRAPTSRSGSRECMTATAYAPCAWRSALANGLGQIAVVGLLDEVRERLGVRVGSEDVAALAQAVAQLLEVLDDAVVDDRDLARAVGVGMGVEVIRPAVRRPARVGEADDC